jgi:streptogramin lyase
MAFNVYTAGWSPAPSAAIIGPDGNLWAVNQSGDVFKFDTTSFTTTTYSVAGATTLISIATDGTSIYVTDEQATSTPFTLVYKVDPTTGGSAPFYDAPGSRNGGSIFFDGSDLWVVSFQVFLQLDLTGAVLNSYTGPHTIAYGRLLTDGTYWFCGSNTGNLYRTPVASPGVWTSVGFGNGFVFPGVIVAGSVYAGGIDDNMYAVDASSLAVTSYTATPAPSSPQSQESCFDGASLWFTFTQGGIWQTTTANPATGVNYTAGPINAEIILYDAPSNTIWATGATGPSQGRAYSFALPNPGNPIRLLL